MKSRIAFAATAAAATLAAPATASMLSGANLVKVAQVVLRGKALLNQGQNRCGEAAAVQPQESLLVTAATAAVQKALPAPKFNAMSLLAGKQAATAAAKPEFCANVARNKSGVVGQVANAAQQLGVGGPGGGDLGVLGGVLGSGLLGSAAPAPATPTTTDAIGALLGIK